MHRVRELREEKGLTQVRLAVAADMNPATLNRIEMGKASPNLKTLERLADALGVEVGDFFPKFQASLWPEEEPQRRNPPGEAYFVPLEEGEEEDVVTLRFYYAPLLEGDEPIVQAMREASGEEAAKMRQEIEKSGRTRE
jgi:transcriptional regulator with XRE-family HTH domain